MKRTLNSIVVIAAVCISLGLALGFIYFTTSSESRETTESPTDGMLSLHPGYDFDISLFYDDHRLEITQTVKFRNTLSQPLEKLVFCVPPDGYKNVITFQSISMQQGWNRIPQKYELSEGILEIHPENKIGIGALVVLELKYSLDLFFVDKSNSHPVGNFGYGEKVIQCGDFYPVLTPWEKGIGFKKWPYTRIGDPVVYSIADYSIKVHAEPGVTIAAYGFVSQEADIWRFDCPSVRSWAFIASKVYKKLTGGTEEIPVTLYYYTANDTAARACLEAGERSVNLFTRLFGPYPYNSLILAENAYSSAMEYSGFCTISREYMSVYSAVYNQLLLAVTAHEIAHQWWYGAVGSDQVTEPWLDESLAKYCEYIYFSEYHPELINWWQKNINVRKIRNHYIDDSILDFQNRTDYTNIIYGRSPAFIQDLRQAIGDEDFFAFLQDYYKIMSGKLSTKDAFFYILSKHTDKDLSELFQVYFRVFPDYEPGKEENEENEKKN